MNPRSLFDASRLVVLGLVLSAAGGLGLVAGASAQAPVDDGALASPQPGRDRLAGRPPGHAAGHPLAWLADDSRLTPLLDEVGATLGQRDQIRRLLVRHADIAAVRAAEPARTARQRLAALLAAPTVDPAAVESLRQEMHAEREAVARRHSAVLVEVANVLTQPQRQLIASRLLARGERTAPTGWAPHPSWPAGAERAPATAL